MSMQDLVFTPEIEQSARIARHIFDVTLAVKHQPQAFGGMEDERLPTANDIARALKYDVERVKKRLKLLIRDNLIQTLGYAPKRYRFDLYNLSALPESSPLYEALADPASPWHLEV